MLDIWFGYVELVEIIINISIIFVIPLQLFLCFKVENRILKLFPIITFLSLIIIFLCMSQLAQRWDKSGYIILALFAGILLLGCLISWGLWFIVKLIKKCHVE